MKLSKSLRTGHHANIFSAKFLPNAGTPTIVSVAGDKEIRLMEVERMEDDGGQWSGRWGQDISGYVFCLIYVNKLIFFLEFGY